MFYVRVFVAFILNSKLSDCLNLRHFLIKTNHRRDKIMKPNIHIDLHSELEPRDNLSEYESIVITFIFCTHRLYHFRDMRMLFIVAKRWVTMVTVWDRARWSASGLGSFLISKWLVAVLSRKPQITASSACFKRYTTWFLLACWFSPFNKCLLVLNYTPRGCLKRKNLDNKVDYHYLTVFSYCY